MGLFILAIFSHSVSPSYNQAHQVIDNLVIRKNKDLNAIRFAEAAVEEDAFSRLYNGVMGTDELLFSLLKPSNFIIRHSTQLLKMYRTNTPPIYPAQHMGNSKSMGGKNPVGKHIIHCGKITA